jgi:hypothetical protein
MNARVESDTHLAMTKELATTLRCGKLYYEQVRHVENAVQSITSIKNMSRISLSLAYKQTSTSQFSHPVLDLEKDLHTDRQAGKRLCTYLMYKK